VSSHVFTCNKATAVPVVPQVKPPVTEQILHCSHPERGGRRPWLEAVSASTCAPVTRQWPAVPGGIIISCWPGREHTRHDKGREWTKEAQAHFVDNYTASQA
jgi:hypothetical protein